MPVFAYRLPDNDRPVFLKCGDPIREFPADNQSYFVVHPFLPGSCFHAYPVERQLDDFPEVILGETPDPQPISTTPEEYFKYIERIKAFIGGDPEKKVVASRRAVLNAAVNPRNLFFSLCSAFPNAYVFYFHTEEHGDWTGASPELLIARDGRCLSTMALAGTRDASDSAEGDLTGWDDKNIKEQSIVADHISSVFTLAGLNVEMGETVTRKAGPVEHLMTPIYARATLGFNPCRLLNSLSPTPALAGYPTAEAISLINEMERSERNLYGGFSGPFFPDGDFRFYVTLRCARLYKDCCVLYAGGGITYKSDKKTEWEETAKKIQTLLSQISPQKS